ncbi:hypothetical protein H6P81_000885 [Aristolochia fimbriata]|uniref:Calmodulin binding protein central domain-containing protein n=1 Tax=Aristolochia fimbriata TaxID=158543 RepID=A0AAV7F9C2_ARIFI|nr:hypothetical protein H6P81_000885 [Aristolochia fimbriata]
MASQSPLPKLEGPEETKFHCCFISKLPSQLFHRLGVKVAPGFCDEIRIVKLRQMLSQLKIIGESVWRLDRIAKEGALHKKLLCAGMFTVKDFLRLLVRDHKKLLKVLGSGMSQRMWENT